MEEQQRKRLALNITRLRRAKGWSEADLWQQSGASIQTISRLENARTKEPRESTIQRIAGAFGITSEELAGPRTSPEEMEQAAQKQLAPRLLHLQIACVIAEASSDRHEIRKRTLEDQPPQAGTVSGQS